MRHHLNFKGLAVLTLALLITRAVAVGQKDVVLHTFDLSDGALPQGALIADAQQNLYGVTLLGGGGGSCTYKSLRSGCGTVFELSRGSTGWTEKVLYAFQGDSDGAFPMGGLVMDGSGNLYGTTSAGGLSTCENCGTVFELSPQQEGAWLETVLYRFTDGTDGGSPESSLIFDQSGNLYGTTFYGGVGCGLSGIGCGTVFELSPPPTPSGDWAETTLHAFNFNFPQSADGAFPVGGVVFDNSGNLYGTTSVGGDFECYDSQEQGCGTVFQLKPPTQQGGSWTEQILHTFSNGDGDLPIGNLVVIKGTLGGTTAEGGQYAHGVVFEIAPSRNGMVFTVLYNFQGGNDGLTPLGGIIADSESNFYGTTYAGGGECEGADCGGTVFELSPPRQRGGVWTEKVLYAFRDTTDGSGPSGSLVLGQNWLVGLTEHGGGEPCSIDGDLVGCGVAFAVPRNEYQRSR